jgi:hypothetical protein
MPRAAKAAKALRSRTCAKLYVEDTLFERLAPPCEPVAAARRPRIQEEHAMVRQRPLARQQCRPMPRCVKNVPCMTLPWLGRASVLPRAVGTVFDKTATDPADIRDDMMGARHGRVITKAVRLLDRLAMRGSVWRRGPRLRSSPIGGP